MSQQTVDSVRVYADYVCPFCYLGYESLDRYREGREEPLATEWHPFDLRSQQRRADGSIDRSVETRKDESYYEQARENVERLAGTYDVEMARTLAREVDSYDAQRVAWRVQREHPGVFEQFHRSVFDALWVEGRDMGDPDVLRELAAEAGLPDGIVDGTLDDESSVKRLDSAFEDAQQRRITGVPTFVADERAARGAVPPEQLRRLVEAT